MDGLGWMENLRTDCRYAARKLRRSPGFALAAILTLALGIGANVAVFTVVQAVLLNPLPYPHPEQLVRVFDDLRGSNSRDVGAFGAGVMGSARQVRCVSGHLGDMAHRCKSYRW